MRRTGAHWIAFFGIAATVWILDQLSKAWLVGQLSPGESMNVVGDLVRLVFSQNSGALFGLFRDNALIFGIVSLAVIGLIVAYHGRAGRSLYLSIALGLLLGGALGNVTDRLRLGYVVDFVDIGIGELPLVHLQRRRCGDQPGHRACSSAAAFIPALGRMVEQQSDG